MSICAERIKMLIENSGKSYQELEKLTGIKKSSLQRYASGVTAKIPLDVIETLSEFFGVPYGYLIGRADNSNEIQFTENDLSRRIKELRLARGMTLEQVATIVGVGKSTVRKWETGMISNMKIDKIELLAKALGTTPSYLMGWDDTPFGLFSQLPEHQQNIIIELINTMLKG